MKKISDVFVKDDTGLKYEITLPDGTKSGEFLFLVGLKSREFKKASAVFARKRVEISGIEDFSDQYDANEKASIEFLSDLITGWSFDDEFNLVNLEALLQMDGVADDLSDFLIERTTVFAKKPDSSASGTSKKSSSTRKSTKAPAKQ